MAPSGVMGVHHYCFNQSMLLCNGDRMRIHVERIPSLGRYREFCSSISISCSGPLLVSSSGCHACCKFQSGETNIKSQINSDKEIKKPQLVKNGNSDLRRRFSLRLRPRLRLLSRRLRRVSYRAVLAEFVMFLQRNYRRVAFSTIVSVVLGLCYAFLRLTSVPSSNVVPYSELVTSLQSGLVSKVLFEEGSRRIFYNMVSQATDNVQELEKKPASDDFVVDNVSDSTVEAEEVKETNLSMENIQELEKLPVSDTVVVDKIGDSGVGAEVKETSPGLGVKVLRKFSRTRRSTPEWQYATRKLEHDEKFLLSLMREKGTAYSSAPQSVLMSMRNILITILSLWIPLTPLMWLLYRQISATNSTAKKRRPNNQVVNFNDVEGVDVAKAELMEIVMCLQGAINYSKLGANLPRGVLLVGPPGTGKTLLARAVAGEAGVPFFSVSASEFVEMFVGRGAARIRDLFNVARKYAPSIIFIDELDAVGGKRGRSFNDERDQTLNQLLTEMDGFETDMKVVVIAATNRAEALDPALCRPGRFSRQVYVGEPDEAGRRKILAVHLRGIPLEEDPDLICNLVAALTHGFVGADLANIINEAALLAARRGGETVAREDIMEALERAKFGINGPQTTPSSISKELRRLFPWAPSLMRKNGTKGNDGLDGPLGYQTLS